MTCSVRFRWFTHLACAAAMMLAPKLSAAEPQPHSAVASPLSPEEAIKHFHLPDDLTIELVAAEPDVIDPVAVRFDENGRMWVVEMRDYPLGPPEGGDQRSQIRVLEDKDGDGRYETATLFASGRTFVTGVQPWRGGVIVTEAGAVSYLKDTNGDGRADHEEKWFTGFVEGNTQLRANHPRLGLDGYIYVSNGLRGGTVVNHRGGDATPVSISNMDFRFDPLGDGPGEALSGVGQFGLAFDDWGNRFVVSNRNPVRHIVLENRYLKKSPLALVPAVINDVAAFGEASRIYPLSRAWTTSNLHAGQFTAACGVFIYRGDLLGDAYRDNAFTCDPTGNLVHREIMQPDGASFTSKPAYDGKEWLASPDEWFRPVNIQLGPDGAIYVVDMYRAVIEHPEFMPVELKKRPDQRLGDDRGRIWRIRPKNAKPTKIALPAKRSTEALTDLLEHSNAWQRDTAQRLLLERNDEIAIPYLEELVEESKSPQARAQAMWTLQRMGALVESLLLKALDDDHPQVRRQAVIVSESRVVDEPKLRAEVARHLKDASPVVRFQTALSLAPLTEAELSSLAFVAGHDHDDPWARAAVLVAAGPHAEDVLLDWKPWAPSSEASGGARALATSLAQQAVAAEKADGAAQLILALGDGDSAVRMQIAVLGGIGQGLASQRTSLAALAAAPERKEAAEVLEKIFALAQKRAANPKLNESERIEAIALLAYHPSSSDELLALVDGEPIQAVKIKAIAALARHPGLEAWTDLLGRFGSQSPAVRRAILDGVLADGRRIALLLDQMEQGAIKPSELDPVQTNRLTSNRDPAIKKRVAQLIAQQTPADRAKALADYQPSLAKEGDPLRGRMVFEKNCSTCHKVGGVGVNVAPDISDTRTKKPSQLLADILQPNRAIDNNYVAYAVLLADGTAASGILSNETSTSITLRQPGDKTLVVSRDDIEELKSTGVSLMPEGLEKNIPLDAMADLLAFLKNWRYLDGKTPLGQ